MADARHQDSVHYSPNPNPQHIDPNILHSAHYDAETQQRHRAHHPPLIQESPALAPPSPAAAAAAKDNNNGDLPALTLSKRLRSEHRGQLLYCVESRTVANKDVLAKLTVVDLRLGVGDAWSEKNARELERVMHAYCDALRDWDYMNSQRSAHEFINDPFKLCSSQARDHSLMEESGLMDKMPSRWSALLPRRQVVPDDAEAPQLPGHARGYWKKTRELRDVTERLMYGILGGLALVVPMLVMVLHNTVLTALLTVSVATILFAALCALYAEVGPMQLVGDCCVCCCAGFVCGDFECFVLC